jgi:hypothetical protein
VIAPSCSSSLRRTISMVDLGEDFGSTFTMGQRRATGLGFGLGLSCAIIGECSPPARYNCYPSVGGAGVSRA